jgi:hypothetical protein
MTYFKTKIVLFFLILSFFKLSAQDTLYVSRTDGKWNKIDKISVSCPCTTIVNNLPKIISNKTGVIINACTTPSLPFTCATGAGCTWTGYCQSTPINVCFKENITTINGSIIINSGGSLHIPNSITINSAATVTINNGGEFFVNGGLTNRGFGVPNAIITNNGFFRVSGALSNQGTIQGSGMIFCCGALTSIGSSVAGYDACYNGDCVTWINDANPVCKGGVPMPIEFINIFYNSNESSITWNVNENGESSFYEIEVSYDGKDFFKIGSIKSTNQQKYIFGFIGDYNYYRIKAYNKNGDYSYSKINSMISELSNNIYIYSNDGRIYIKANNSSILQLDIDIYNVSGKLLKSLKMDNFINQETFIYHNENRDLLIISINDGIKLITKKMY